MGIYNKFKVPIFESSEFNEAAKKKSTA